MVIFNHIYTVGERDLVLEIIDAIHKGNEHIYTKLCRPATDENNFACFEIHIECPDRRAEDLRNCLGFAFKAYNF